VVLTLLLLFVLSTCLLPRLPSRLVSSALLVLRCLTLSAPHLSSGSRAPEPEGQWRVGRQPAGQLGPRRRWRAPLQTLLGPAYWRRHWGCECALTTTRAQTERERERDAIFSGRVFFDDTQSLFELESQPKQSRMMWVGNSHTNLTKWNRAYLLDQGELCHEFCLVLLMRTSICFLPGHVHTLCPLYAAILSHLKSYKFGGVYVRFVPVALNDENTSRELERYYFPTLTLTNGAMLHVAR